ncbi:MAG TPA: hypothetical protein VFD32_13270, partial [Dehalococcoidia bacterium]|nr:hypothetical protein [Dehalococcoidia bacterium]
MYRSIHAPTRNIIRVPFGLFLLSLCFAWTQRVPPAAVAQTAPGLPTLIYPAEGQTVPQVFNLQWTAPSGSIPGTTQYEVIISDPQTNQWIFNQYTTATTIAGPGASVLQPGHEYFWTVQACNGSSCSGSARAFGFFISTGCTGSITVTGDYPWYSSPP